MKRNIRRNFEMVGTLLGILVIFGSVLFASQVGVQFQFFMVLFGILLMEIGVWGLSSRLMPNERKFTSLRQEGDRMIVLIRKLHAAALVKDESEEAAQRFQDTLAVMHDSVKRMSEIAAQRND